MLFTSEKIDSTKALRSQAVDALKSNERDKIIAFIKPVHSRLKVLVEVAKRWRKLDLNIKLARRNPALSAKLKEQRKEFEKEWGERGIVEALRDLFRVLQIKLVSKAEELKK